MLEARPISYKDAATYVNTHHRHHKAPVGHKYSISCYNGNELCGVVMVGRPVSRHYDDGMTLEVNRLCTDGTKNACSFLYQHAWRAAKALGYKRMVTYTLQTENGTSLKASGWKFDGEAGSGNWTGKRRRTEVMDYGKNGDGKKENGNKKLIPLFTELRRLKQEELPRRLADPVEQAYHDERIRGAIRRVEEEIERRMGDG